MNTKSMLNITNLNVAIADADNKHVLKNISMQFQPGQNYCLLGKNGSWKSSLALSIMWHPNYEIIGGDMCIDGKSLKELEPHERAQKGIFLAFQTIPEIKWVKLFEFLRTIYSAKIGEQFTFVKFKKIIVPMMKELHIDTEFLRRDLNVWFSGGERRKIEILQLKLLEPTYIFLDEVDSGLDVDAFKAVAELMQQLNNDDNCFIFITHYFTILDYITIDKVYVLQDGSIIKEGDHQTAMRN